MMNELDLPPASPKCSVRFEIPEHRGRPALQTQSPLISNLMRTHVKDHDPLFYYEVLIFVGVGSMGSVATVQKSDEVVGGSARKDIVDSFCRQEKEKECFSMPVLGGLSFDFVWKVWVSESLVHFKVRIPRCRTTRMQVRAVSAFDPPNKTFFGIRTRILPKWQASTDICHEIYSPQSHHGSSSGRAQE